ncbi:unnamed protein product [Adineta ricciae]|uniref:WAP domain-containing protein n=1 Tax=Adineta ricciae TaxID=249248 RepID=A0A814VG64_ADIRI|nr:unnamed protein product [Adineta ricciae]
MNSMNLSILLFIGCLFFIVAESTQPMNKGLIMHQGSCPQPPFHIMCRRMVCLPQMIERTCSNDGQCKENEKCCHVPCSCKIKCVAAA